MGNAHFIGFKIADSHKAGFQLHLTNLTKEEVVLRDSLIIGMSNGNSETLDYHVKYETCALIAPRTDGFRSLRNKFINFGAGMNLIESVSENNSP